MVWTKALPLLLERRQYDEAQRVLDEVRQRFPDSVDVYHWLTALCLADATRTGQSLEWAEKALALDRDNAHRHWMLGRAQKANNQIAEALGSYRKAVALNPAFAEAWVSLGIAQKASDDLDGAIDSYQRAISLRPDFGLAHANLGNAVSEQARRAKSAAGIDEAVRVSGSILDDAIAIQKRAVELDPQNLGMLLNYATLLDRAGDLTASFEVLNEVLGLDPTRLDACVQMGGVLFRLNQHEALETCYRQWLEDNGPHPVILGNLAIALSEKGSPEDAMVVLDQARALESDDAMIDQALAAVSMKLCDIPTAIAATRAALGKGVTDLAPWTSMVFALNYVEGDPEVLKGEHARIGDTALRLARGHPDYLPFDPDGARRDHPTKIRLGFSSADFRKHSVTYFMEPLFERLDRTRYELYLYHNGTVEDEVTDRFKALADKWHDCALLPDMAFCRRVREDAVDVLIDLTGYTYGPRAMALAARCAPVQAIYLGYPTTSGNPSIDFRITDGVIDPPGGADYNTERVLRFGQTMFCYAPPADAPLPRARDSQARITFGSFNNAAKLSDHTLELWSQVLAQMPDALLLLKAGSLGFYATRTRVLDRLAALGISRERVLLNPWFEASGHHLDLYNQIDVALDCFPYNGATTSCEALWMGTPVVSRCGTTHVARVGASILSACGLSDWVCDDDADFVDTACRVARDLAGRNEFRLNARSRLRATRLLDADLQSEDFMRVIEQAWALRAT